MKAHDSLAELVVGYPKLAAKFEIDPDLAIYRRFGALNALNLLYYQAELTYLEGDLKEQQKKDAESETEHGPSYALNWYWLKHSEADGDGHQLKLILKIREILKEYNEAMIQQATMLGYEKPTNACLHNLQRYFGTPDMGNDALLGDDATIWGSKDDVVALKPRAKRDAFSAWAATSPIFNWLRCGCIRSTKSSPAHSSIGAEDTTIYRTTYWVTSIVASLIPISSIVVLYQVQSMSARLAIIAVLNVLLSICLVGAANAQRAEVFAITAAFAAVQVVFVSADKSA